ncbi:hypothetical protein nbrc107696_41420 [Gordonia spumicola]|uniref:Saccharopine dehydrogenase NADP binding domain-containing protein n=1 Tax=Gordonia spumicola TaxID=589161 RepID=A0A7I9VEB5_9ACTN|nr:saccharopine dehydrogenase NADP-binding domain-containing protein [Gordonia spumicola]GEE03696.1 hypothetical protein nbrc107696_41420 [Gordonia spumicola]
MRVAVLGAGTTGSRVAAVLADMPQVESLTVADADQAAAACAAGPTCVATTLDVADGMGLRRLLDNVDVVVSTVGPFYSFGTTVLQAAIDVGVDYVDICDDWEPTVDMLALDDAACAAGICAVIGAGASPGLSTLLAAEALDRLDSVRDAYTAWPLDAHPTATRVDSPSSAAPVHWMHQCSGAVAEVCAGAVVEREPLRPITLTLPGGRRGTAYTVGHPEPVTLHRTVRPAGDSACLMLLRRSTAAYLDILRSDIDAGRLTPDSAAALLEPPSLWHVARGLPRAVRRRGAGTLPGFFAAADGLVDGRPTRVCATWTASSALLGDMAAVTGVPAALATAQIGSGRGRPGVHPPDAILDRASLFDDLAVAFPGTRVIVEEAAGWLTT